MLKHIFISFFSHLGISLQRVILVMVDLLSLLLIVLSVILLRALAGNVNFEIYHLVWPFLFLAPLFGTGLGLYQNIRQPPYFEFRSLFWLVSLTYGVILSVFFLIQTGDVYSRFIIFVSWVLSVCILPFTRYICRKKFSHKSWWGEPVIILDQTNDAKKYWKKFRQHSSWGLRPVKIINFSKLGDILGELENSSKEYPDATVLLLYSMESDQNMDLVMQVDKYFKKILLIPHIDKYFHYQWFETFDIGFSAALMIKKNLRHTPRIFLKRCIDLVCCILLFIPFLIIVLILAIAIKLDSKGPVFYKQKRLGYGGKIFEVIKFRTMYINADDVLNTHLMNDANLKMQWEQDHKLKNDPRITRIGKFLRCTSLDELPQIFNVFKGEMSIVGPRPIVEAEKKKYGKVYGEYCMVKPGITGMWQISGRNNTSYSERIAWDRYYINNWCVWLDIWILAKTVPVVLTGDGAY